MWPFNKNQKDEIACQNIITDYLLVLPASGDWDDDEILNSLECEGHDKRLSWFVITLIPTIIACEYLKPQGFNLSVYFYLADNFDAIKNAKRIQFDDFPACRAIKQSQQRILAHPNIMSVIESSAIFDVINQALNKGSIPEDLHFTGVLLVKPDWM
jgi:hypothetical protein